MSSTKNLVDSVYGVSPNALLGVTIALGMNVRIGPFTVIGLNGLRTAIGDESVVASHVLIEGGAHIGARCVVDAYCRVCAGVEIGDDTQILYGAAVFESARIGRKCIIGGNVADRTIIEDYVTFFGEIVHDYRVPGDVRSWDDGESRPSPVIRARSVVGQNALLVGGIEIGPEAYVAAGETVRCNVPTGTIFIRGEIKRIESFKGFIQTRSDT